MKKIFSILITTVFAFVGFTSPVNAYYEAEKHSVDSARIQYFKSVEDRQFIIDLPKGYYIDELIKDEIYLQLDNTNKALAAHYTSGFGAMMFSNVQRQ